MKQQKPELKEGLGQLLLCLRGHTAGDWTPKHTHMLFRSFFLSFCFTHTHCVVVFLLTQKTPLPRLLSNKLLADVHTHTHTRFRNLINASSPSFSFFLSQTFFLVFQFLFLEELLLLPLTQSSNTYTHTHTHLYVYNIPAG